MSFRGCQRVVGLEIGNECERAIDRHDREGGEILGNAGWLRISVSICVTAWLMAVVSSPPLPSTKEYSLGADTVIGLQIFLFCRKG